ncbi:MAG TPA: DNA gyrase inhibitor YacG [Stellaceae bacterium]|nr:DNA gyrase inhibitor YacG [Stellaceae bacterium]
MSDEKQPEEIPTGICPICGKRAEKRHRPFCSHRCALIDLGRWLGGNYHVPAGAGTEEDEDTPPGFDEDEG